MRPSPTANTALYLIITLAAATGGAQYAEDPPAWVDTWEGVFWIDHSLSWPPDTPPNTDIPASVTVDANGDVYVAGYEYTWKFTGDGAPTWDSIHRYFYGVAIAGPGQVLLSGWNPPLRLLDATNGSVMWTHGSLDSSTPNGPTQFAGAFHSAFDDEGNFFVTDYGWSLTNTIGWRAVHKCSLVSGCTATWGTRGVADDQFIFPTGIAFDAVSDSLFVMDSANHRLKNYTTDGDLIEIWTGVGSDNIEGCKGPEGVAADLFGNIYVADTCNHQILKYDPNGNLLTAWGSFGAADGHFYEPSDVHVTADETVYVVDRWNYRIQIFRVPDDDGDGVDNNKDNCPDDPNPGQSDLDIDELGDECDPCPFDPENDADGDGLCAGQDACPYDDPGGLDADLDGCTDDLEGLVALVVGLGLYHGTENALLASINAAAQSVALGDYATAADELGAFINKVQAQRGKKIPVDAADFMIAYANNIIASFP